MPTHQEAPKKKKRRPRGIMPTHQVGGCCCAVQLLLAAAAALGHAVASCATCAATNTSLRGDALLQLLLAAAAALGHACSGFERYLRCLGPDWLLRCLSRSPLCSHLTFSLLLTSYLPSFDLYFSPCTPVLPTTTGRTFGLCKIALRSVLV